MIAEEVDNGVELINYEIHGDNSQENEVTSSYESEVLFPFGSKNSIDSLLNTFILFICVQHIYSTSNIWDDCREGEDKCATYNACISKDDR